MIKHFRTTYIYSIEFNNHYVSIYKYDKEFIIYVSSNSSTIKSFDSLKVACIFALFKLLRKLQ